MEEDSSLKTLFKKMQLEDPLVNQVLSEVPKEIRDKYGDFMVYCCMSIIAMARGFRGAISEPKYTIPKEHGPEWVFPKQNHNKD